MKTSSLLLQVICLTMGLSWLSTTTEGGETSTAREKELHSVAGPHLVWFADGCLTVKAQDVPLGELIDEIAKKSGVTVAKHVALDRRVSLEFHRLPLEQALRRILRHRSFVLEYAEPVPGQPSAVARVRTLSILPQGHERYSAKAAAVRPMTSGPSEADVTARIWELQAALASGDAQTREEAVVELGESERAEAVGPLSLALADANEDIREAAVFSLTDIGGAHAAKALDIALADRDPRVREAAVDALGEIGGEVAIALLERALSDKVKFVREAAAEMLDELRGAPQ